MSQTAIEETLRTELQAIARDAECELLDAEFAGGVLRLTLDHPDGVTLAHCETVSRQASALLDVTDFGPGGYTLEVSSPGLDRPLYGVRDFVRFAGEPARVTYRADDAPKRTVVGTMTFDASAGVLTLVDSTTGIEHSIAADRVIKARLEPQF